MIATIINALAIILGALVGLVFARKITDEMSDIIASAAGIVTLVIGMQMAFQARNVIYLALALILGGILGTWWDIDGLILALGRLLERRFGGVKKAVQSDKGLKADAGKVQNDAAAGHADAANPAVGSHPSNSRFAYAFLNSSVLFCVGAMAIVGSFKAGVEKDYTMLFTKSVLDGFMAIVFAAAMGVGTAFSALSILAYQGLMTLGSGFLAPFMTERMIAELTGTGGALVLMIAVNLLGLRKLKTANYLPALLIVAAFVLLDPTVQRIAQHFV